MAPSVNLNYVQEKPDAIVLTVPTGQLNTNMLSIKKLLEKQEESQAQGTYIGNQPKEDYSFDQVKMLWRRFAFDMKERGMETFYNAMIKREPIREDNDKFKMLLDNQIQHDYITTHLQDMNAYFRKELKNYNVQISLEINDKPEEETKFLTGKEKYQALARKNPNLHTLKNTFNLDVEY